MTRDEILSIAKYIAFPSGGSFPKEYDSLGVGIVKLPVMKDSTYASYPFNWHHYTTRYHRDYVYPMFADLLKFTYDPEDFEIVPYSDERGYNLDLSYMRPKPKDSLTVKRLISNTESESIECTSDDIAGTDNHSNVFPGVRTNYHRLYVFGHQSSVICNRSSHNGRKLLLSGDSQLIPDISFLSHYFDEVWMFDNRSGGGIYNLVTPLSENYADVTFTDAVMELFGTDIDHVLKNNLK